MLLFFSVISPWNPIWIHSKVELYKETQNYRDIKVRFIEHCWEGKLWLVNIWIAVNATKKCTSNVFYLSGLFVQYLYVHVACTIRKQSSKVVFFFHCILLRKNRAWSGISQQYNAVLNQQWLRLYGKVDKIFFFLKFTSRRTIISRCEVNSYLGKRIFKTQTVSSLGLFSESRLFLFPQCLYQRFLNHHRSLHATRI